MSDVRELESLIVTELQDIKSLESELDERFAGLRAASPRIRASFREGLMDLEARALGLEVLVDALAARPYPDSRASA